MVTAVFPRSAPRLAAPFLVLVTALVCGFLAARAFADQPHMQAALEHLRAARQQLEVAAADKAGHRVKAIRLVNEAIAQVERGLQYERSH
jgi:hypothetical protein